MRQAKQFMRNVDASFDERKFGFSSLLDLIRAAQREGLFKLERDRQGSVRLFPGPSMPSGTVVDDDNRGNVAEAVAVGADSGSQEAWLQDERPASEPEGEVVEAAVVQEMDVAPVVDAEEMPQAVAADAPARGRRTSRPRAPRKPSETPRPRKTSRTRTR